ncbi:MAG: orotidine-5'-phosphate decarboxylase [bacterium]
MDTSVVVPKKKLEVCERLIVAADFKPVNRNMDPDVEIDLILEELADAIGSTGVYIKINSGLRCLGHDAIRLLHRSGLKVFGDLKLNDIPETLSTEGYILEKFKPELLTVMCTTGVKSMAALKNELPNTEILGVTVLTHLGENECVRMFGCPIDAAVMKFAEIAAEAKIDGLILSPREVSMIRAIHGNLFTYNTPAIRPAWSVVAGDDQNKKRVMTPAEAIKAGADRIVVGRPILQAPSMYDAIMRTLEEIDQVIR